ncbi:MAG: hypothetical protein KGL13_08130, partial [Gammaproteobacteria bacterium]|nr:hypothetical protein [Gammaproteobacteria bacterium]
MLILVGCLRRALFILIFGGCLLLVGCPSQSNQSGSGAQTGMSGAVYGGRQPISGATVIAYAVNPVPGNAPSEIANATTDANGNFSFSSFSPPAGDLVYLESFGGNANGSNTNSAIDLMTVAGIYGSASFPSSVNLDELTTVAGTAALQSYLQIVACSSISGNTQSGGNCVSISGALDLARMAGTVDNLVDVTSGQVSSFLTGVTANTTTLEKLDTLANVL